MEGKKITMEIFLQMIYNFFYCWNSDRSLFHYDCYSAIETQTTLIVFSVEMIVVSFQNELRKIFKHRIKAFQVNTYPIYLSTVPEDDIVHRSSHIQIKYLYKTVNLHYV